MVWLDHCSEDLARAVAEHLYATALVLTGEPRVCVVVHAHDADAEFVAWVDGRQGARAVIQTPPPPVDLPPLDRPNEEKEPT
jgi:hypothetical protein